MLDAAILLIALGTIGCALAIENLLRKRKDRGNTLKDL
jgi:hypothetical protein